MIILIDNNGITGNMTKYYETSAYLQYEENLKLTKIR